MADTNPAAITAAHILKFNSVKHKRTRGTTSSTQETPLPTYIGIMMHAHTRKKELVDRLSHLGLSISYDRVLQLSAQMGNSVCQQFHREHVYQGGHVWGQILLPAPELPPPTNWGWSMTGGQYTPYWTRLPEAAHSCIELVSCKCQKGCVRCCKCKKAALQCTALCVCEGDRT